MSPRKLTITLSFCISAALVFAQSVAAEPTAEEFQAIADAVVEAGVPAVAIRVEWSGGFWEGSSGSSSVPPASPIDSADRFRIASITKLFTAVLVLQLVDEGRLDLDDKLAGHLKSDIVAKIPHAEHITIRQLLDHTSGVRSFTDVNAFWKVAYREDGLARSWPPEELIEYALKKKPYFEPGAPGQRHYSNTNYILLGMVVEAATGHDLAQAYSARILDPLSMQHTFLEGYGEGSSGVLHSYFIPSDLGMRWTLWREGIKPVRDDGLLNMSSAYPLYNSWAWAAGGLISNVSELATFMNALRSGKLLTPESTALIIEINSAESEIGFLFGGSGGWDGIATSLYEIDHEIVVVVLMNGTGIEGTSTGKVIREVFEVLRPPKDD